MKGMEFEIQILCYKITIFSSIDQILSSPYHLICLCVDNATDIPLTLFIHILSLSAILHISSNYIYLTRQQTQLNTVRR